MQHRVGSPAKLLIIVAMSLVAGCFDFGPKSAAIPFRLHPVGIHMLAGDTTSFFTQSCAADSLCPQGNVLSNWTLSGTDVAAMVSGGVVTDKMASRSRIHVQAIAIGTADITAVASGDSTQSKTVRVTVTDSAAITKIDVWLIAFGPSTDVTPLAGARVSVYCRLRDNQGNHYSTQPTQWSVSDTSILQLDGGFSGIFPTRSILARRAGSAYVIVRFRHLEGRLLLTVGG